MRLLYSVLMLATVCKVVVNTLKALKASSSEDVALLCRDLLICWIVFIVIVGWEASGLEILIRWIPGYYIVKSCSLVVVAFPQLRLARVLFYDAIKPAVEHVDQYLVEYDMKTPIQVIEAIPFLFLALVFPSLGENPITEQPNDDELFTRVVDSKLKSTSKKLSILTEYLDELELRSSTIKNTKPDISSVTKEPSVIEGPTIFTRLNILEGYQSPEKDIPENLRNSDTNDTKGYIMSPRHDRRRSLEVLQNILQKQASSTLNFINSKIKTSRSSVVIEGRGRSGSKSDSGSRTGSRSSSRTRSGGNNRPSSRNRPPSRQPSSENLLLMDPMVNSNITTRHRLRNAMVNPPRPSRESSDAKFTHEESSQHKVPSTTFERMGKIRDSLGKDIDNIFRGISRPSAKVSMQADDKSLGYEYDEKKSWEAKAISMFDFESIRKSTRRSQRLSVRKDDDKPEYTTSEYSRK